MGARMAFLDTEGFVPGQQAQTINVAMPPSVNVAIPGPYMIFVLIDGTPSVGNWVTVQAPRQTHFDLDTGNLRTTSTANHSTPSQKSNASYRDVGVPKLLLIFVITLVVVKEVG